MTKSERPKPRVKDQEVLVKNHRPRTRTQRPGFKPKPRVRIKNSRKKGKELKIKGKHDNVEVEGIEGIDIESSNVP